MFTVENIIGDIVYISFRDKSFLGSIALPEEANHFKVLGQDGLGLWLEHPNLTLVYTRDKHGKPVPKDNQKVEELEAVFLVSWSNILTLMHYPNRDGFDFPSEFDKPIGFKSQEEQE